MHPLHLISWISSRIGRTHSTAPKWKRSSRALSKEHSESQATGDNSVSSLFPLPDVHYRLSAFLFVSVLSYPERMPLPACRRPAFLWCCLLESSLVVLCLTERTVPSGQQWRLCLRMCARWPSSTFLCLWNLSCPGFSDKTVCTLQRFTVISEGDGHLGSFRWLE